MNVNLPLQFRIVKVRKNVLNRQCPVCKEKILPGTNAVFQIAYTYKSSSSEYWHFPCFEKEVAELKRHLTIISPEIIMEAL